MWKLSLMSRLLTINVSIRRLHATKMNWTHDTLGITNSRVEFKLMSGISIKRSKPLIVKEKFEELALTNKVLSKTDWQSLKQRMINEYDVSASSFTSQMMNACSLTKNYSLGRSLMQYIRGAESIESPNIMTLSKYMYLCGESLDQCDERIILEIYDELRRHQSLFDLMTLCDIIHGLCQTSRWKESFAHIETIKNIFQMTYMPFVIYKDLALASFRNGDFEDGWKLMQLAADVKSTNLEVNNLASDFLKLSFINATMMDRFFGFLRENDIITTADVIVQIKLWFERRPDEDWDGNLTSVTDEGCCLNCGSRLEDIILSPADFDHLRSNFISRSIQGDDVYLKTNPYELKKFIRFVERTSPYSIVLDGLNVAFTQKRFRKGPLSKKDMSEQLLIVARQLDNGDRGRNSRKMLILGRHHMGDWPKATMTQLNNVAHVFFLDDQSVDDPFTLYAAMHSGQGTYFVSRDLMRNHLFSLRDNKLQSLFRKWQLGHQLFIFESKTTKHLIRFHEPCSYLIAPQRSSGTEGIKWHIPYEDGLTRLPHEHPNSWLCLTRKTDRIINSLSVKSSKPDTSGSHSLRKQGK